MKNIAVTLLALLSFAVPSGLPAPASAAPAPAAPAPAAPAAAAPGIRVVVRHEGLLRSETRALDALVTALTRRKLGPVTRVDATPAEAALFGGAPAAALPAEWGAGGVVVLLHVLSPTGQPDGRRSSGLGSVLVFRPPEVAPV